MNTLNFDTGIETFSVNGKAEVSFNPTDSYFVERFFDAFDTLDKKQEAYKAEAAAVSGKKEMFELARRRDVEMREMIDAIFQKPVCADVFGDMNVYAIADGLPVWSNFLLVVMDKIDGSVVQAKKATNPRIAKYTAKYHK